MELIYEMERTEIERLAQSDNKYQIITTILEILIGLLNGIAFGNICLEIFEMILKKI